MLSYRHHIHLICDLSDVALYSLQDHLRIFFESKARLTHDLFVIRPESSAYSWQCINNCDFAILLVGDSYGQLANIGVSQLHISYLNAKTKNKPMVAFIKKSVGALTPIKETRQLNDFINLVNNQVDNVILYDDESDLPSLIQKAYALLQAEPETAKFLTGNDIIDNALPLYDITEKTPVLTSKAALVSEKADEPLIKPPPKLTSLGDKPINPLKLGEPSTSAAVPHLNDELRLTCNAQAFRGGTLLEVTFTIGASWREILSALARIPAPFSTQGLWRVVNDIATPQAMPAVQMTHPEVHAISRCQVVRADTLWVRETLLLAGWIEVVNQGREMWQVTSFAKRLIGYNGNNVA